MYTLLENLETLVEIQPDSIVSRNVHKDETMTAILFGFDAGQELTEHTASRTAVLQLISGEATITLGTDRHQLEAGCWIHMPPHLPHSILAKTPVHMLLLMI
ncbi:MAG: cupin domain-containing protein [Anaerolineales bacterium]|nr:cupin domain-containing protein [Anaerolineales bacterium]